jgi:hypothetical protein
MTLSRSIIQAACACLAIAISVAPAAQAQTRSAGLLNFSSDGSLVACSNRDSGSVTIMS